MNFRWSESITYKFVQLYCERECLWDYKHINYNNRTAREAALEEMVILMDLDDFDIAKARKKIKNLRDTYIQELIKIDKSRRKTSNEERVYVPQMKWFSLMHRYLKDIDKRNRRALHSTDELNGEISSDAKEIRSKLPLVDSLNVSLDPYTSIKEEPIECLPSTSAFEDELAHDFDIYEQFDQSLNTIKSLSITDLREDPKTSISDKAARKKNLLGANCKVKEPKYISDEFEAFGIAVAIQLRKLNIPLALEAQIKIQTILRDAFIQSYKNRNYHDFENYRTTMANPQKDTVWQQQHGKNKLTNGTDTINGIGEILQPSNRLIANNDDISREPESIIKLENVNPQRDDSAGMEDSRRHSRSSPICYETSLNELQESNSQLFNLGEDTSYKYPDDILKHLTCTEESSRGIKRSIEYSSEKYFSNRRKRKHSEDVKNKVEKNSAEIESTDLFFQSMILTVKALPPVIIVEAKMKIFKLISELELKILEKPDSHTNI